MCTRTRVVEALTYYNIYGIEIWKKVEKWINKNWFVHWFAASIDMIYRGWKYVTNGKRKKKKYMAACKCERDKVLSQQFYTDERRKKKNTIHFSISWERAHIANITAHRCRNEEELQWIARGARAIAVAFISLMTGMTE